MPRSEVENVFITDTELVLDEEMEMIIFTHHIVMQWAAG